MIAFLQGKVVEKGVDRAIIQGAGVGFDVLVSRETLRTMPAAGKPVKLFTLLRFKQQEGVFELYGFATQEEKNLFDLLLSVDKIGPKTALNILGAASPEKIRSAIKLNKIDFLVKVVGLTDRTAERLVVELSHKIKTASGHPGSFDIDVEVEEALCSLGFTKAQIRKAIDKLDPGTVDLQARVRQALKLLTTR